MAERQHVINDPEPPRTLIIIPAYNEAASISGVIADVRAHVPGSEILVVDDGSTDATAERAEAAGARVLRLAFNLGIGGAMRTGFRLAADGGFELVAQVDADGQHLASELPKLLSPVRAGDVDVMVGTRYRDDRGYVTPAGRRLGQRLFSTLVNVLTGGSFTDTTSGFRAYGREAVRFLAERYARDYPEVNALVDLTRNGFRVRELPVRMRDRQAGASSISLWAAVYYMLKVPLAAVMSASRRRSRGSDRPPPPRSSGR